MLKVELVVVENEGCTAVLKIDEGCSSVPNTESFTFEDKGCAAVLNIEPVVVEDEGRTSLVELVSGVLISEGEAFVRKSPAVVAEDDESTVPDE